MEVRASRRTGQDSIVSCMRKTMEQHYGDKSIALGGTFILQKGKAKIHIMVKSLYRYLAKIKQNNTLNIHR